MENSLTFVVGLQILIFGCVFLFLWIRTEGKKSVRIPEFKKEDIWRCPICTYVYVETEHEELSTCPRCGSINRKGEE